MLRMAVSGGYHTWPEDLHPTGRLSLSTASGAAVALLDLSEPQFPARKVRGVPVRVLTRQSKVRA